MNRYYILQKQRKKEHFEHKNKISTCVYTQVEIGGIYYMVSDAKKAANRKWDAANMTQLKCSVRRDRADAFRAACAEDGTTVSAVLLRAVND